MATKREVNLPKTLNKEDPAGPDPGPNPMVWFGPFLALSGFVLFALFLILV